MKLTDLLSQRNHTGREADFSHMPTDTVREFIMLKMKDNPTKEEARRLEEIESQIRYKPSRRDPHIPQAPRGDNETAKNYVKRMAAG